MVWLFHDANDAQHPAGKSVFRAMREEVSRIARGAHPQYMNGLRRKTCIDKLAAVRLHQIEVEIWPKIAMTRRPRREKQHGIFFLDRIEIKNFLKQFVGINEL